MSEKSTLRKSIREQVGQLTDELRQQESVVVLEKLAAHPLFQRARTVMLYYSLPDEVATHEFVAHWAPRKQVVLPVVKGDDLELRLYRSPEAMEDSSFHIQVPTGEAFTDWASIDLIVVPGMAFDAAGHRMGRGRGYYDRFLSQEAVRTCPKLGICFRCQLCEAVPFETHDVPMDAVLVP